MPLPTGVVSGPLIATRLRRIESSTWSGIGWPKRSTTPSPASWTSHSMSTPVASMARRAASLTSGPTPSPGISVIVCRAMHPPSVYAAHRRRGRRRDRPPSLPERRADRIPRVWSDPLPSWYAAHGRHHLPWRHTRDPWAVLLSEVLLQQPSVGRVLERWGPMLERWPDPAGLAATPLDDLLRAWDGLGYPRRARSLHLTAQRLAAEGWPEDETGLRSLPGVGPYTARALLALCRGAGGPPPRDVNLGRVAARAGLGLEPHQAPAARLDEELLRSRPAGMDARDHTLALFDLGATVCRARAPRCGGCPVAAGCASRERLAAGPPEAPP